MFSMLYCAHFQTLVWTRKRNMHETRSSCCWAMSNEILLLFTHRFKNTPTATKMYIYFKTLCFQYCILLYHMRIHIYSPIHKFTTFITFMYYTRSGFIKEYLKNNWNKELKGKCVSIMINFNENASELIMIN